MDGWMDCRRVLGCSPWFFGIAFKELRQNLHLWTFMINEKKKAHWTGSVWVNCHRPGTHLTRKNRKNHRYSTLSPEQFLDPRTSWKFSVLECKTWDVLGPVKILKLEIFTHNYLGDKTHQSLIFRAEAPKAEFLNPNVPRVSMATGL